MNKWIFSILFFCSSLASSITPGEIGALLHQQAVINGVFGQERYLRGMDHALKSDGRFVIARGNGLWWYLEKPFPALLKVTSQGIYEFHDGKWKQEAQNRTSGPQIKLFLALLDGDWRELYSRFELSAKGNEQDWQIRLMPKTALMKKLFDHIQITGATTIEQIQIQEKQGDRTRLVFSDIHPGWSADKRMRPES